MGKIVSATFSHKQIEEDSLRINPNKGQIKMSAQLIKYRDKDTRQIILYIPSLEITGYGATLEKAKEILDFSISEYFNFLSKLSQKKLSEELMKMGWKRAPSAHKQFSKVFISSDGELQNFNAVADEIEHLTVQA